MVRVHHCFRFVSQKVFSTCAEPTGAFAASADGFVCVATEQRRVEIFRVLDGGVESVGGFPTVSVARRLGISDARDYVATLEEKNFQSFVRVYFRWRRFISSGGASGEDEKSPGAATRVRLAVDVMDDSPASADPPPPAVDDLIQVVEVSLKDHASAVAVCPASGDLGVAVNRGVYLYRVVAEGKAATLVLKFILNLDQVASDVTLLNPFVGVVYATAEIKVFRIDRIENECASPRRSRASQNFHPRVSRTRRPVPRDYQLSLEGAFVGSCKSPQSTQEVVFLRRPSADYAAPDTPTSSLTDVILLPAIAQERRYEGTENFDMVDLETLEARGQDEFEDGDVLAISGEVYKPTLCLYKSFVDASAADRKEAEGLVKLNLFERPDSSAAFCVATGVKGGFMHAVPRLGRRSRLLAKYPFTSPPFSIFSDGTLLHALTDNGLESFPCRSFLKTLLDESRKKGASLDDLVILRGMFPPEEVALLGLTSFIGAQSMVRCVDHVILLTKTPSTSRSDSSWALYALESLNLLALHDELLNLAARYKTVSRSVCGNLLLESHFLLHGRVSVDNDETCAAKKEVASRCFEFQATKFPDGGHAESYLFSLAGLSSVTELVRECRRVSALEETSAHVSVFHEIVVKLSAKMAASLKSEVPLADDVIHFLIASHVETRSFEGLAALIVDDVIPLKNVRCRPLVIEGLREKATPLAGVVLCFLSDDDEEKASLIKLMKPDFLTRTCLATPTVLCESSAWTVFGNLLMNHRLDVLTSIVVQLIQSELMTEDTVLNSLCEFDRKVSFLESLNAVHPSTKIAEDLLEHYLSRLIEKSLELTLLVKVSPRQDWLNELPPFDGKSPPFETCRRNDSLDVDLCACESCNGVLLRTQALMGQVGAVSPRVDEALDRLERAFVSLRVLRLLKTDFAQAMKWLARSWPSTLARHVELFCGSEVDKWKAAVAAVVAGEGDEVRDSVLKSAAILLNKRSFLESLPADKNSPMFATWLDLNERLRRVDASLDVLAKRAGRLKKFLS